MEFQKIKFFKKLKIYELESFFKNFNVRAIELKYKKYRFIN